ncbi:hypothetical protein AJ81_00515 [Pseudothermotoga hypogea DSM 11164 = NBRC 106472]|uniref:UVR domain-containing protein n=1 Tax=Pseudothermotoga hypogea DSM 11164 = NBRC 106472 TaxID=1123384 RepID=A0A0X1KNT7_9THEM|nr:MULTISPECIES: hypothetical protein [Pseudothermotoga]AJC72921.1 hypothetical protein AJ81_00515 [Pseudothermotoga hypogea DSM 11164 = NBRC 106472]MDI6862691.1 hypothetical protein [Pseudothermotoga sp.]
MSCDVCKTDINVKVYKFLSDGIPKEVHMCSNCLRKTLKEAAIFKRENLKYLAGYMRVVQDSDMGNFSGGHLSSGDLVFSIAPVAVLRELFAGESESQLEQREVAMRHLYVLKHRLEEALKREDYKSAHKIKNQISMIEKTMLGK